VQESMRTSQVVAEAAVLMRYHRVVSSTFWTTRDPLHGIGDRTQEGQGYISRSAPRYQLRASCQCADYLGAHTDSCLVQPYVEQGSAPLPSACICALLHIRICVWFSHMWSKDRRHSHQPASADRRTPARDTILNLDCVSTLYAMWSNAKSPQKNNAVRLASSREPCHLNFNSR
jgi:hypothetical protein